MRVLVTGGAGFIGSHTVDALLRNGHQVRILDALLPPVHVRGSVPAYILLNDVELIQGDVRQRSSWERALDRVDAVFHFAAYQDYLPDFSTFFHTNTVSTAHLFEVVVEKRIPIEKVIIASSQAVYGEGKYRCPEDCGSAACPRGSHRAEYPGLRDENRMRDALWDITCPRCGAAMEPEWTDEAVVNPLNQYGISKYTQEMIALNLGQRYEIPTTCLRYSIVQGARQSFRNAYSGVLRIFVQQLLNGKPPTCYEDGRQLRDYVSVHDVVRANLMVLEDRRADFQIFNVGGDRRISVLDYACLIAARAGVDLEPRVPGLYRFGDTRHIVSDTSRLKDLGWRPTVSLEEVADEYITWAASQPGFGDYSVEANARMAALGTVRRATGAVPPTLSADRRGAAYPVCAADGARDDVAAKAEPVL